MLDSTVRTVASADLLDVFAAAANEVSQSGAFPPPSAETVLADLGFDSVQLLELVCCLEERLEIRLSPTALAGARTVGDVLGVLGATRHTAWAA